MRKTPPSFYDPSTKTQYLNSRYGFDKSTDKSFCVRIFVKLAEYEKIWECDITEQPSEIIEETFHRIMPPKSKDKKKLPVIITDYIKWRKKHGLAVSEDAEYHFVTSKIPSYYNHDRKVAYLEYKKTSKGPDYYDKTERTLFEHFKPYEEKWGSDLSEQPSEILIDVLNNSGGLKKKSVRNNIYIIKDYLRWCESRGYVVNGTLEELDCVKVRPVERFRQQMVSSPAHLRDSVSLKIVSDDNGFFECGLQPPSSETIDIVYRVFLWMAFMGIPRETAFKITKEDVDIRASIIYYDGRAYRIYDEFEPDFVRACTLDSFVFGVSGRKMRSPGNLILRGLGNSSPNYNTIASQVTRKLSCNSRIKGGVMTYERAYWSGIYYRVYTRENKGYPIDFSEVIAIELSKAKSNSKTKTAKRLHLRYRQEYLTWKEAFYPDEKL